MKNNIIYPLLLSMLIFGACSKEAGLEKTIFFPDPDYPELPKYSEWGYNTFGAFYDRQAFVSTNNIVPLKVIVKDGATTFRFSGRLEGYRDMSILFVLPDYTPSVYTDLMDLNGKTIDLKSNENTVVIKIDNLEQPVALLNGNLDFVKVQNLYVDKVAEEVILSGEFEFQIVLDDEPFTVSRGRFDMGVSYDNFFVF